MGYGVGGAIAEGIQAGWQMGQQADASVEHKREFDAVHALNLQEETRRSKQEEDRYGRLKDLARMEAVQNRLKALEDLAAKTTTAGHEPPEAIQLERAKLSVQMEDMQREIAASPEGRLSSSGTGLTPTAPERPNVASADVSGLETAAAAPAPSAPAQPGVQPAPAVEAPVAKAQTPQQKLLTDTDQASQDLASRLQTGQTRLGDVKPGDFALLVASATKRDPLKINDVRQHVADFHAGMTTGNNGLTIQGLNGVFAPVVNDGVGQPSPYGGKITGKTIIGLDPAQSADGSMHADRVIPRLQVTTDVAGPDGTPLYYHAPMIDPKTGKVAAIPMTAAMNHIGAMGALTEIASHPDAQALLAEGAKDPRVKAYLEAFTAASEPPNPGMVKESQIQGFMRHYKLSREEAQQRLVDLGVLPRPPQPHDATSQAYETAQQMVADGQAGSVDEALAKMQRYGMLKQPGKYSPGAVHPAGGGGGDGAKEEKLTPGGLAVAVELAQRGVPIPGGFSKAGISRGNAILNSMAEQEEGGAGSGSAAAGISGGKADSASLGFQQKRVDAVESGMKKIQKDITIVSDTIKEGNLDLAPWLNKPLNAMRSASGSPSLAAYALAVHQVATEYERQITGGQLSVAQLHAGAQEQAEKILNGSMNVAQVNAVLPIMLREIENGRAAAHEQLAEIRTRLKGGGASGTGLSAPAPAGPAAAPVKITDDAGFNALPSGALFIGPDGQTRRKP